MLDYIKIKRPEICVLENVPGLVQRHKKFFKWILDQLTHCTDPNGSWGPNPCPHLESVGRSAEAKCPSTLSPAHLLLMVIHDSDDCDFTIKVLR